MNPAGRLEETLGRGRLVTVVGAGFSGLTCAYYLARAGFKIEIFESSSRVGGLIHSRITDEGLIETAANGILNSARLEELFQDLGLTVCATESSSKRRYIFTKGRGRRWPLGFRDSLRVVRFALRAFLFPESVRPVTGETVSAWSERVLSSGIRDQMLAPALQGIYAGNPDRMSAMLIVGRFFVRGNKKPRPKIRGTVSCENGMGELMNSLVAKLQALGAVIRLETAFDATTRPSDPVLIATSAPAAAKILLALGDARSAALESIEMLTLATSTLFFETTDRRTRGFGVLFAKDSRARALGVLKNDFIFRNRASKGLHSETWILGGATSAAVARLGDIEIKREILKDREEKFGLVDDPKAAYITRWDPALPHYTVRLEETLATLERDRDSIFLTGNYLGRLGLSNILEDSATVPGLISAKGKWS